jgi:hypothetical protein
MIDLVYPDSDRINHIAERVARKIFKERGDRAEAHLSEHELALFLVLAIRVYNSALNGYKS